MEEGGHTRSHEFVRFQEVPARQGVGLARLLAGLEYQLRGAFGMLTPQCRDFLVLLHPFGNGGPPVTEHSLYLRRRVLLARN